MRYTGQKGIPRTSHWLYACNLQTPQHIVAQISAAHRVPGAHGLVYWFLDVMPEETADGQKDQVLFGVVPAASQEGRQALFDLRIPAVRMHVVLM